VIHAGCFVHFQPVFFVSDDGVTYCYERLSIKQRLKKTQ